MPFGNISGASWGFQLPPLDRRRHRSARRSLCSAHRAKLGRGHVCIGACIDSAVPARRPAADEVVEELGAGHACTSTASRVLWSANITAGSAATCRTRFSWPGGCSTRCPTDRRPRARCSCRCARPRWSPRRWPGSGAFPPASCCRLCRGRAFRRLRDHGRVDGGPHRAVRDRARRGHTPAQRRRRRGLWHATPRSRAVPTIPFRW